MAELNILTEGEEVIESNDVVNTTGSVTQQPQQKINSRTDAWTHFKVVEAEGKIEPESIAQKKKNRWPTKTEYAKQKTQEFANRLKKAVALPLSEKPPKESWKQNHHDKKRIRALEKYALELLNDRNDRETQQELIAVWILQAMEIAYRRPSDAAKVLINIGYFSLHENLDLIASGFYPYGEGGEVGDEVERLLKMEDVDGDIRIDLTDMKVYAIDPEDAEELDDGLSVERLEDGRIKIWIHIADPTSFVQPNSLMDLQARNRMATVYLPTGTYPMFPQKLAMEGMSLKQGKQCRVVSTSVLLNSDGSFDDYSVEISTIKPTHMLTYKAATELLNKGSDDQEDVMDLRLLSEAAQARLRWRSEHGATMREFPNDPRLNVRNVDDPEPSIQIYVDDRGVTAVAHRIVDEMMYLCCEVIAKLGSDKNIPLPYRGEGKFNYQPTPHRELGLNAGYVQFTSPIRRYNDLLAHYQVKSYIARKKVLSTLELQSRGSYAITAMKAARTVERKTTRYWLIEHLRRSKSKGEKFSAKVLTNYNIPAADILITDFGLKVSLNDLPCSIEEGDTIQVQVEEAEPRDNIIRFRKVPNDN